MKLTKKQFAKIEHLMPIARKLAVVSNNQFMCAILYLIENGCKWRALPKSMGNGIRFIGDSTDGQRMALFRKSLMKCSN